METTQSQTWKQRSPLYEMKGTGKSVREDETVRSIDRLTHTIDQIVEMMRDDWRRQERNQERILEKTEQDKRELIFRFDALRSNDIATILDCLRVIRADAEKAALELDRPTLDRLRKQKYLQEQGVASDGPTNPGKQEEFDDGVTASGRGLNIKLTWRMVWGWGKWIVVGGGGYVVHHVQQWLHLWGG